MKPSHTLQPFHAGLCPLLFRRSGFAGSREFFGLFVFGKLLAEVILIFVIIIFLLTLAVFALCQSRWFSMTSTRFVFTLDASRYKGQEAVRLGTPSTSKPDKVISE